MASITNLFKSPAAVTEKTKKAEDITPPGSTSIIAFQIYFEKAYKKVKDEGKLGQDFGIKTHVPISIFLRSKGTDHAYAGKFDEELHYSASLIKVAAMFAAFKLRNEATLLIDEVKKGNVVTTSQVDFFNKLEARLNLGTAVPIISSAAGINKKPIFVEILSITGFPNTATLETKFTDNFRMHLRKMIIPSDNCSAGECIWRLSYPYINVKLMEAGFFDKASMKGIWLCGDYIDPNCTNISHKQRYLRIDTINDCDQHSPPQSPFCGSAQNTTSKQMARLFLEILTETLIDGDSSREMRNLLREGQQGSDHVVPPVTLPPVWNLALPNSPPHRSYLTRLTAPGKLHFTVDAVKVGFGSIKPDLQRSPNVRSEGIIIKWNKISRGESDFDESLQKKFAALNLTGEAAISWQNTPDNISLDGVAEIINESVSDFINQIPLIP